MLQHLEGLTDRQAADAVRRCIDWKYLLSLELTDPGFDFSLLSDFRERVLTGGLEQHFLDTLLTLFKQRGLLKARGRQRTDSTHVGGFCISPQKGALAGFGSYSFLSRSGFTEVAIDRRF